MTVQEEEEYSPHVNLGDVVGIRRRRKQGRARRIYK